ncbi:hypothetical protein BC834DRAFT_967994 [Gloeopeniophorella convolvens]|nr:hypothetical protein BC834DRAFT_967994 [Gloeopeniophorella convolvens]
MPRASSKNAPSISEAACPDCGTIISRLSDMKRHRLSQHPDGTETRLHCPHADCTYTATQKSNLKAHCDARHSNELRYACVDCGRRFSDPAARTRHRKNLHGYQPKHREQYLARKGQKGSGKEASLSLTRARRADVAPYTLPLASSSRITLEDEVKPEVNAPYHDQAWSMPADASYTVKAEPVSPGHLQLPLSMAPGYDASQMLQYTPSPSQMPQYTPVPPLQNDALVQPSTSAEFSLEALLGSDFQFDWTLGSDQPVASQPSMQPNYAPPVAYLDSTVYPSVPLVPTTYSYTPLDPTIYPTAPLKPTTFPVEPVSNFIPPYNQQATYPSLNSNYQRGEFTSLLFDDGPLTMNAFRVDPEAPQRLNAPPPPSPFNFPFVPANYEVPFAPEPVPQLSWTPSDTSRERSTSTGFGASDPQPNAGSQPWYPF